MDANRYQGNTPHSNLNFFQHTGPPGRGADPKENKKNVDTESLSHGISKLNLQGASPKPYYCKEKQSLVMNTKAVYVSKTLAPADLNGFKAAGAILYRFAPSGGVELLLGIERRPNESGKRLHILGGRRDPGELSPVQTAAREFHEESGKIIDCPRVEGVLSADGAAQVWYGPGKYVLYVAHCPSGMCNIDQQYEQMSLSERGRHAEMLHLVWVPWGQLVSSEVVDVMLPLHSSSRRFNISHMLRDMLQSEAILGVFTRDIFSSAGADGGPVRAAAGAAAAGAGDADAGDIGRPTVEAEREGEPFNSPRMDVDAQKIQKQMQPHASRRYEDRSAKQPDEAPLLEQARANNEIRVHGCAITLVQGNIVEQGTEGIVSSANSHLQHTAGVARAIRKAAGRQLEQESEQWLSQYGPVPAGAAAVTTAGSIRGATYVFHAVGPRLVESKAIDADFRTLQRSFKNSLKLADSRKLQSLAVPALSCGMYGFPTFEGGKALISTAMQFCADNPRTSLREIRFVPFGGNEYSIFQDVFEHFKLGQAINNSEAK